VIVAALTVAGIAGEKALATISIKNTRVKAFFLVSILFVPFKRFISSYLLCKSNKCFLPHEQRHLPVNSPRFGR